MTEVTPGLVSIIIPTYKRNSILRAVNSVLTQDYGKLEVIVVDDNADFPEYRKLVHNELSEYISEKKITLIQNTKNLGGALARNEGILASHGEYIAFLDDDDWYLQGKITKQVRRLRETNADIVYCWSRGEDRHGNIIWENRKEKEGNLLVEAMTECIANTSLIMCRREAIFKVGLFEEMPCKQDVYLELKLAIAGASFVCVREVLVVYGNSDADFQRISNVSPKTLIGMNKVRELARTQYTRLSRQQIAFVEGDTAYKLCNIARTIGDRATYKQEYRTALKYVHSVKKRMKLLYHLIMWEGEKGKNV